VTLSLRIAFDLDGVLADMDGELVRQAERLFGPETVRRTREMSADPAVTGGASAAKTPADTANSSQAAAEAAPDNASPLVQLNLSQRQQRKLWHHVESIEDFWLSLNETETGIVAKVGAIARERRWEVIFLTKRPESAGATAQLQTQRWLEARGFALPSVFVVQGSRGRIAASLGLDIVVDDRPENCLDVVVDSRARAILVWRDDTKHLPGAARRLGIGVVWSVAECLEVLAQIDSKDRESPRVIDRVKRLLGLKEPASA
jgi:hypothetical protein